MNKTVIVILVIVILAALGVGGYFLLKKPSASLANGINPLSPVTNKVTSSDPKVQSKIDSIYASPDWLNSIKTKAATNGVTLEQQILADAQWCAAGNC